MRTLRSFIAVCLAMSVVGACSADLNLDNDGVIARLIDAVGVIQTRPQVLPTVLVDEGNTILINTNVTIIEDPDRDIIVAELPNLTVLVFENDTGWDIYIKYYADNQLQGIYVYDGEALLLEYPCLSVIELISEDDVDPFSGVLVDSFDLIGADFFNPQDFFCGDAFILNFDPFSVNARAEVIDLVP